MVHKIVKKKDLQRILDCAMKEFNLEGKISISEQKDNTINDRIIKLLRAAFSTEHLWWLRNNLILLIYIDRL